MTEQPSLLFTAPDAPHFDAAAAQQAKDQGIERAAANKGSLLKLAREIALELAAKHGEVYSDLVMAELIKRGIAERAFGNAAGATFIGGQFVWTGRFHKSTRTIGHGNLQRIWRVK